MGSTFIGKNMLLEVTPTENLEANLVELLPPTVCLCTVNPPYNDIRYNSKIRYNVNSVCTKISGSCIFSLIFPCYSSGKHTFCVFARIASPRRF